MARSDPTWLAPSVEPLTPATIAPRQAVSGDCLDTWSDSDDETWGFYPACHDGDNQKFVMQGPSRVQFGDRGGRSMCVVLCSPGSMTPRAR